jgi:hypothetical protein
MADLDVCIKDLAKQLKLTWEYLEARQALNPSRNHEARPSTSPRPQISFEIGTSRVKEEPNED